MMSELIPSALERKQPCVFISGPSFAREVMEGRPTAVVAACKDHDLNRTVQELFANQTMRVNTTGDVVGVEICGEPSCPALMLAHTSHICTYIGL